MDPMSKFSIPPGMSQEEFEAALHAAAAKLWPLAPLAQQPAAQMPLLPMQTGQFQAEPKWWASSKTMLMNSLVVFLGVTAAVVDFVEPNLGLLATLAPGHYAALVSLLGALNLVLRVATVTGVSWRRPPDAAGDAAAAAGDGVAPAKGAGPAGSDQ